MTSKRSRLVALVIAIATVAAACSGGARAPEVALEARWQCDVQRQTFNDLAALNAELDNRLEEVGLTRADYDVFKEQLSSSADLRLQVSEAYEAYCLS